MATLPKTVKTQELPQGPLKLVYHKHHLLVRFSHWLNIVALLGLGLSGLSIYWAAPVYQHAANPATGNQDYFVDFGDWVCKHVPQFKRYGDPDNWFYNHFSLGPGILAEALRLHWLFAYLFMLIGLIYLAGLFAGGGYRSLLPRRSDLPGIFAMLRYYFGLPFAKMARRAWPHPHFDSKYNPLQRAAYFSMPILGTLAVASGWAIHKPQELGWLQGLFGGYDRARAWHFWIMWAFAGFVIPHVVLVIADGWDTLRSMITGWSERSWETDNGN